MAWGKIYANEATSDNQSFDTGTVTASTNMQYLFTQNGHTGNSSFILNGDNTSGSYSRRHSINGAVDADNVINQNTILNMVTGGTGDVQTFFNGFMINISSEEKLMCYRLCFTGTAGVGVYPQRIEGVFKWDNTSAQITRTQISDSGNGFDTGSNLSVLGDTAQTAVPAKIQDGLIFEETDTNKHYIYTASTDTWTEL